MKTIQRHRQHRAQDTEWRQSRDTGNIGNKTQDEDNPETQATLSTRHRMKTTLSTRHRMKTIQRHRQHWAQDTGWRQSRDTGNIEHKTQDEDNPETQDTGWRQSKQET
jgi:hypothetical protein